jgi:hypothetical protein
MVTTPDRNSPNRYGYIEAGDMVGSWHHTAGTAVVSLSAGVRFGFANVNDRPQWLEGSLTQPVTNGLSMVIGGGKTPADLMLGIPASHYLSIAFKNSWQWAAPAGRPPSR